MKVLALALVLMVVFFAMWGLLDKVQENDRLRTQVARLESQKQELLDVIAIKDVAIEELQRQNKALTEAIKVKDDEIEERDTALELAAKDYLQLKEELGRKK